MGMLNDLVGGLLDMGELSKLQKTLEPEIKNLISSGKCPEELSKAFDFIKNFKGDGKASDATKSLESFVEVLEKNKGLFSDEIQKNLPKMKSVVQDLIKKASDIETKTK